MVTNLMLATIAATLLSLGLNRLMIAVAPLFGLMDQPGERRVHTRAVPRAGGLAIWLSLVVVLGAGYGLGVWDAASMDKTLIKGFGLASLVLVVVGVIDDRFGMPALVKLGGQALAVLAFCLVHPIANGILLGISIPVWAETGLFVAWGILIINAYNLIDGLDGLCGGLGLVSLVALGILSLSTHQMDNALILLAAGGAVAGFLRYNLSPARIFLGDTGSMLIGLVVAVAATEATGKRMVLGTMLLPIAVAGVPLLDVLLAIWRRSARGVLASWKGKTGAGGVFTADKDHLHHRLMAGGVPHHKVSRKLHLVAIFLTAVSFLPAFMGDTILPLALVVLMVIGLTGLRNFARIELVHSGSLLHMAVKRAAPHRWMRVAYGLHDLAVISGAVAAAMLIETNLGTRYFASLDGAARVAGVFVIALTLALHFSKVYRRVWSRASLQDSMSIFGWVLAGGFAAMSVLFILNGELCWSMLRFSGFTTTLVAAGIILPRLCPELVRELALDAGARGHGGPGEDGRLAVICGAGDLGNLFIEYLKICGPEEWKHLRILGFLDDEASLRGRMVRGFPVLGGFDALKRVVAERGVRVLVLAVANMPEQKRRELLQEAETLGLEIYEWGRIIEPKPMPAPPENCAISG